MMHSYWASEHTLGKKSEIVLILVLMDDALVQAKLVTLGRDGES